VALLFGLCYDPAAGVPPGHVSSHLGHGESVARFLSHAAQPTPVLTYLSRGGVPDRTQSGQRGSWLTAGAAKK
jgi:hypothetical protein